MSAQTPLPASDFVSFAQQGEERQALSGQIATRLRAGELSSIFGLLPNPDPVLKAMGRDLTVYRSLLADGRVKSARSRRAAAVLAMERGLLEEESRATPARVRKACEQLISGMKMSRLVNDWVDGAMFGYRISELVWAPADGLVKPKQIIAKPSHWFGFDPDTAELRFRERQSLAGVEVPQRKFVVVGRNRSWENPYGEPDLASVFWPVTFKRGGLKFWVTFTEKYGSPWAVGKLPRSATQQEHDALADKLAAMVRDAVATMPDDASVELLTVQTMSNADLFERLLNFCNAEISVALLGNNQSVEANSNRASATAAQSVEADLRDADAEMVADGVNQVLRFFCELNYPGAPVPVFGFWEQEDIDEQLAKRDELLTKAGAKFTNAYFQRTYRLEPGDLAEPEPPPGSGAAPGAQRSAPGRAGQALANPNASDGGAASFADAGDLPPDQAAIEAAVASLPADELQVAMQTLLKPALDAIQAARTPEQVQQALVDAWPDMDVTALQTLMERAYFVADLVGRDSVVEEAGQND